MKSTTLLVTLTLLTACGSSTKNPNNNVDFGTADPGIQTNRTINIEGLERRYKLFLPQTPSAANIVMILHGNRGSSAQVIGLEGTKAPHKIWLDIALRDNLILIAPDGETGSEGHQGWNDCRTDAPTNPITDDVLFLGSLIDAIAEEFNTPDQKAFVVGTSNGGMMAMRLADEVPEKLHAFASVVASRPINTECPDATAPMSALIMNGTADPILPYTGGHIKPQRGELYSTLDAVNYWVNRNQTTTADNGISLPNMNTNDNSTVTLYSYSDGIDDTQVKHYEVVGGGHTEPSIAEQYGLIWKTVVGEQNNDVETAEEIWRFFSSL